ncbi:hypothetical protein [Oscillatoria nigro-viridis]|uniref:hypothetical protein n=1 Tax=Phormidium nigroviride TaxID=482564 RepID=UPI00123765B7
MDSSRIPALKGLGSINAQLPYRSCLFQRIGDRLFLLNDRFEHGLMGVPVSPTTPLLRFLALFPFTARPRNITAWGRQSLTDCAGKDESHRICHRLYVHTARLHRHHP